jgi:hypothetical protein
MIGKLKKQYQISTDKHAIAESSQLKEISIVIGIKDQYVAE